jgi:hypothetical protein
MTAQTRRQGDSNTEKAAFGGRFFAFKVESVFPESKKSQGFYPSLLGTAYLGVQFL